MKKPYLFMALFAVLLLPLSARAGTVAPHGSQECTSNEQCVLVSTSCQKSCSTLPVNEQFEEILLQERAQRCGPEVMNTPKCTMHPPLAAMCINNRCTLSYPHNNNSHDGDYRNGGYQGDKPYRTGDATHTTRNDKDGNFTAYDLPPQTVKQGVLRAP